MPATFLTFVEYESTTSYDGNDLFHRAFDSTDQSGNSNDKWDLPQLDTNEKTDPKVLNNLTTAAVFKRSVKDAFNRLLKSMQDLTIEQIHLHPK